MKRTLFCLTLCTLLLTIFSPLQVFAKQPQDAPSFFSFFKNYLIAYTAIDKYNKHVLAAQTQAPTQQISLIPSPSIFQSDQLESPVLSDVSSYLLQQVNDYRSSLGLSSVKSSNETCAFAAIRAQEIASGFNHNGFYDRVNNHTIPYIQWSHATENIAQAPDYHEVVTLWKNSPEHAANMRDNTPYVCIMQYQSYYAYEGMRL